MSRQQPIPGGRRKHRQKKETKRKSAFDDSVIDADMGQEYRLLAGQSSKYWQPKVDEQERVYPVKVYDAEGQLKKTWTKKQLMARQQQKYHWNNHPMV